MGIEKLHKLELIGGLLVLILGVTNIIQVFLLGTSDPKGVALYGIYGLLFLIGGSVFFVVCIKEKLRAKMLIIATASILLIMCPISNSIYLLSENGGLNIILLSLSVINIILCVTALPLTFIRYVDLEEMDTRERISHISLILFRGSGFFHLLQPVLYDVSLETLGMLVLGTIYILIAFMLPRRKDAKPIQLIGFILPIIGASFGIVLLFIYLTPYVVVFIIFDLIIIPIRFYYIKTLGKDTPK